MQTTERFEKVNIEKLIPYARNARTHSKEQIIQLRASLREFGFVNPTIIDKDYNIIAGHGRIMAAKEEGFTEVPCVFAEFLTEAQKRAYIIADNRLALNAGWDAEMLSVELSDLKGSDFDISLLGFDEAELNKYLGVMDNLEEDDFDVDSELKKPAVSRLGDIWLLGRHRLLCGDSTKAESYEKLMDGKKANLVVTDPPYNINIQGGTKDKLKIQNDNMPDQDFYNFLLDFYKCTFEAMADGAAIYVFHADTEGINFRTAFKDAGFHLSGVCIWVKNSLVLGRSDYHFRHEPILYGWKPTQKHNWYSDRKQSTIWNFDRPTKSELHPTMKPISLISYPITNSSMTNCIVLDPFGGSGTTLITCEQTGRICNMIEFDTKYCDVIVNRFLSQVGSSDDIFLIRDGIKTSYSELEKSGENK